MKAKLNVDNWVSNFLIFRNWLIKNLILLLILPLTVISIIFINYGEVIEKILLKNPVLFDLFQLKTQLKVLSEIDIPSQVKSLGYDSVIFIILIFFIWLFNHTLYCYLQLSYKTGSRVLLFFETILLLLLFIFIVSPHFSLLFIVLGYSLLAIQIILIGLYSVYSLKLKK
jgi:hypothetical protein